nr:lysoplasmalogenase family protein [Stenotrophomonas pictorum]
MGGRKVLTAGIVIAAAGAILGGMAGGAWLPLHYVGKPLATLLILGVAATAVDADRRYRRWIVLGLVFSLMGDVWLMLPGDYFVAGLIAFLLAHLAISAPSCRGCIGARRCRRRCAWLRTRWGMCGCCGPICPLRCDCRCWFTWGCWR